MSSPYPDNPYAVPGAAPPVKKGMSPFLKVVLTLSVLFGMAAVCCCGVIGGGVYLGFPAMEAPKVRDVAKSIVDIEVPKAFEPQRAFDWSIFQLKWVEYVLDERGGVVLMECPPENLKEGIGKQLRETLEKDLAKGRPAHRVTFDKEPEIREFVLSGEKCKFEFRPGQGDLDKAEYLMVKGEFPSKGGVACLMVVAPTSVVSEAEIEAMLQSIKK